MRRGGVMAAAIRPACRISVSCAKFRGAQLARSAAHCAKWSVAEFCATFCICDVLRNAVEQNMGERRQERTAYTVLGEPNGAIAE